MSLHGIAAPAIPTDPSYTICVELEKSDVLVSPTTSSLTNLFSSISLLSSHPVFSADTVDVLASFSTRSGGVPLHTFQPTATVTIVAHASGDDLYAEQFEVLWQFRLFALYVCSAAISETARDEILTLGGTQAVPRRNIGNYTGEEHYLGWTKEHFIRFFHEYIRSSILQAGDCVKLFTTENWRDLQMPRWLSAVELSDLSRSGDFALDRSLQDIISSAKNESPKSKKSATHRRNLANRARRGEPPQRTG